MTATNLRPPAVAGLFYPEQREKLQAQVEGFLAAARAEDQSAAAQDNVPLAIVTPHAGYIYSGATTGVAWAHASRSGKHIKRVLLLGPSHRVALRGLATSPASHWQTPLGPVPLDQSGAKQLQALPFVQANAAAHAQEHSLEVQLPFIQLLFPEAELLPLVVGEASPAQVAEVIQHYWQDGETLVAISSDLSHYHDYRTAQRLDRSTSDAIEHCDISAIGPEQACGCRSLCGLLEVAASHHCRVATLDLRNSGDTAGDKQRVVGYGAYAVH